MLQTRIFARGHESTAIFRPVFSTDSKSAKLTAKLGPKAHYRTNVINNRDRTFGRVKHVHPHAFLWERLELEPSFLLRTMFGTKAVYLDGKLVLCFAARSEPWRGLLVCTDQQRHDSILSDFPLLAAHPILPKWLYLPESLNRFESIAIQLVKLARARDPRIGITPKPRHRKNAASRARRL